MKNLVRNFSLAAIAFLAFSCSNDDGLQKLAPTSISKIVDVTPELSSLKEALEVTGLTETFDQPGDYTVFAPTNAAFSAVLGGLSVADFNTANPGVLADVLKYHVLTSRVTSGSLSNGLSVATLLGQNFTVNINADGEASITDGAGGTSNINVFDAKCSNGIIHVIDAVLLPSGS